MSMNKIFALAPLMIEARNRTGNQKLGQQVKEGKFQLVTVTYKKGGASTVTEMSDWMEYDAFVKFLGAYNG